MVKILGVVVLLVLGAVFAISRIETLTGCADSNSIFKAGFLDHSKILYIKPLGDTQIDSPAKSKIVLKVGEEVPIYNPTDATLEGITQKGGEHTLILKADCGITYQFDYLDKVSEKIQPQTSVKKGDLLGYVNSATQGSSFNFMVSDRLKPVSRINPKRWTMDLNAQCPYDYFDTRNDNNLRRDYTGYTLIHNENIIQRAWSKEQGVSDISCGSSSHDTAGTASGGWFKGESTDVKGDYLSVNKYLSTVQVSTRRDGKLVDALTDYSPDIFVADVKQGNSACYQDANQNKWAYVKLVSETQLALTKGSGSCPASFPQSEFSLWER